MANAVEKLILEEIQGIDEMLTIHAYHKQVLSDLLKKMEPATGKIEIEQVVPPIPEPNVTPDTSLIEDLFRESNEKKQALEQRKLKALKKGTHISELKLSIRPYNCLISNEVWTIEQLIKLSDVELKWFENLGEKSLAEIKDAVKNYGLEFKENKRRRRQIVVSKVARLCREKGYKKSDALRDLVKNKIITDDEASKYKHQMGRSHIDDYDRVFWGTKYANEK